MDAILKGQVWRLVTWVFSADSGSLITLLFLYCVYNMARSFEQMVGTFRMNVYLVGGMILNLLTAILVYFLTWGLLGQGISVRLSNYDLLFAIFMALALCMPEATVYLSFLFPIKMKWMLVIYLLSLLYEIYTYFFMHWTYGIVYGTQIILALVNLFVFCCISGIRISRAHRKRQRQFQAQMNSVPRPGTVARHTCAICGRTEKDNPDLMFRYCSKCSGNKEYCNDHLFIHEHM
jgi:hypothetical protein